MPQYFAAFFLYDKDAEPKRELKLKTQIENRGVSFVEEQGNDTLRFLEYILFLVMFAWNGNMYHADGHFLA